MIAVGSKTNRPVWAEIDLSAIRHNVAVLQERNQNKALMAVVKANGYGHGAVAVAKAALEAGAVWLGVATPEEGAQLREAGIAAPILVLGAFYPGTEQIYLQHGLTATLATPQALQALAQLAQAGSRLNAHLKVDTGMGRLGFLPDVAANVCQEAISAGVHIDGIYTHLATADEQDTAYAMTQLARFRHVLEVIATAGVQLPWRHAGNSAALLQLPLHDMTLTRAGIALYGLPPSDFLAGSAPIRPAMTLCAQVVSVRRLPAGSAISYGSHYVTDKDTNIAVLPLGYADGYTRRLSHKAEALLHNRRMPIVGSICMDQCMVDVGDEPVRVGDTAVLIGRQGDQAITADELATLSGTINYEIVCAISERVPRIWR